jgi:hypothetical protein
MAFLKTVAIAGAGALTLTALEAFAEVYSKRTALVAVMTGLIAAVAGASWYIAHQDGFLTRERARGRPEQGEEEGDQLQG